MNQDVVAPLHDCASEPIRFSGAIQPHGILVSCEWPGWTIHHVSANADTLFDVAASSMLGGDLRDHVTDDLLQAISDVVSLGEAGAPPLRAAVGNVGPRARLYDISVHVADALVHVEFEGRLSHRQDRAPTVVAHAMIARAATISEPESFQQRAAEQMRLLTGHDRVLIYRFLPDGAGEVIAEARDAAMESLLGLRFPEADIPAQARALYARNRIRVIPDTGYVPVPILPATLASGEPMDLGLHILRSVSPVHREYARNIGVRGSMSISILDGAHLWGLIVCHHRVPLRVTATVRAAAELFGLFVSMRVTAHEQAMAAAHDDRTREVRETLWRELSLVGDLGSVLAAQLANLAQSLSCDGVALHLHGQRHRAGITPAPDSGPLQAWLDAKPAGRRRVFATDHAADWVEPDAVHGLAGVLAIRLGNADWLLLFRAEQIEHVVWASEPVKLVAGAGSPQKLRPRARLEAWRETIRGRSTAWNANDHRMAERTSELLDEFHGRGAPGATDTAGVDVGEPLNA